MKAKYAEDKRGNEKQRAAKNLVAEKTDKAADSSGENKDKAEPEKP